MFPSKICPPQGTSPVATALGGMSSDPQTERLPQSLQRGPVCSSPRLLRGLGAERGSLLPSQAGEDQGSAQQRGLARAEQAAWARPISDLAPGFPLPEALSPKQTDDNNQNSSQLSYLLYIDDHAENRLSC